MEIRASDRPESTPEKSNWGFALKDKLTTSELGALLGLSDQTIRDLARRGVVAKDGRSFPLDASVRSYAAHMRQIAAGRGDAAAVTLAAQQRARVLTLQGDKLQLEMDLMVTKLIDADDLARELRALWVGVRARLMSLSSAISGRVPVGREGMVVIDDVVRESLIDMARFKYAPADPMATSATTAQEEESDTTAD